MKYIGVLVLVLLFGGCSALQNLGNTAKSVSDGVEVVTELVSDAKEILETVKGHVDTATTFLEEAGPAADSDGDGKTSLLEWLAALGAALGLGGAGLAKVNSARRERTDELYDENVALRERVTVVETRLNTVSTSGPLNG